MATTNIIQTPAEMGTEEQRERIRELGSDLGGAFRALFGSVPGSPHRPSALARDLGLSRVIVSRLLGAIECDDPFEVLERVPGPDSLRGVTSAACVAGAPEGEAGSADDAVDRFASMIREEFGTRAAFNAALSSHRPEMQKRLVLAGRYQVYQGMRQILGVEADTWLTSMMFVPSSDDKDAIDVTTIHGALGMRRLRQDVGVHFSFGPPGREDAEEGISRGAVDLREFYSHEPAPIESAMQGGQLVHRLAHDRLGRQSTVDMLAVSHNANGSHRYATPERPRAGVIVFADVPVRTLVCDALVHEDVFAGSVPELMVFNPGSRGPANPLDQSRQIDRVDVPELIESLSSSAEQFALDEVPRYGEIVGRVCEQLGQDPSRFRVHRLRMSYPVHGFQFVMAFDAPQKPA